jgi:multisubunit Na+/H+ antiporter MnhE subunit
MAKWSLRVTGALSRAAVFFALWLLLVDATDEPNLLAGGVIALAAAFLAALVQSHRTVHPRPSLAMLRRAYRPLLLLVTDTGRVTLALFQRLVLRRDIRGKFRAVRYRAGGDDPADVGRRLVSAWAASVAPNRYAIGIDRERDVLIIHELVPTAGPLDPLELG